MKVPKHCYEIQIMYVKVSETELLIKQKMVFSTANKEKRSYLWSLCWISAWTPPLLFQQNVLKSLFTSCPILDLKAPVGREEVKGQLCS